MRIRNTGVHDRIFIIYMFHISLIGKSIANNLLYSYLAQESETPALIQLSECSAWFNLAFLIDYSLIKLS
jgi:hypothetical protein